MSTPKTRPATVRPDTFTLIMGDTISKFLVVFPSAIWFLWFASGPMGLSFKNIGPGSAWAGKSLAIWATLFGALLLIGRIVGLRSFFSRALEVEGIVNSAIAVGKRATIKYNFDYRGKNYRKVHEVWASEALALREGQEVTVLFDPTHPKKAFLKRDFE